MTAEHRDAIVQRSFAHATRADRRDWALYADCFTDPCEFDFSSWNSRPAMKIGSAEWARIVAGTNATFDATQHMMSNHVISLTGPDDSGRDTALGVNELIAQHWFSAETMASFGRPDEVSWCPLRTVSGWTMIRQPFHRGQKRASATQAA